MEAGKTGDGASYTPGKVAAAERLLSQGWWNLREGEKKILEPLIAAGLSVGVNPDFSMLGLKPSLVLASTKGKASLFDVVGEDSFAFRSYYSSSLRSVMLAAPPVDEGHYYQFWQSRQREGLVDEVIIHPLHEVRFLMAPLESFNEDTLSFDFTWTELPRRRYTQAGETTSLKLPAPDTLTVLNQLQRNPMMDSLGELSAATGVGVEACSEASKYVIDFPVGWGFKGADGTRHSGILLYFEGLSENVFGPVRASVRDIPFSVLEAWGKDYDRYVYFAELMVPAENLSETTEFLGRVTATCASSFSYGFYEPTYLNQFAFSKKLAANEQD